MGSINCINNSSHCIYNSSLFLGYRSTLRTRSEHSNCCCTHAHAEAFGTDLLCLQSANLYFFVTKVSNSSVHSSFGKTTNLLTELYDFFPGTQIAWWALQMYRNDGVLERRLWTIFRNKCSHYTSWNDDALCGVFLNAWSTPGYVDFITSTMDSQMLRAVVEAAAQGMVWEWYGEKVMSLPGSIRSLSRHIVEIIEVFLFILCFPSKAMLCARHKSSYWHI